METEYTTPSGASLNIKGYPFMDADVGGRFWDCTRVDVWSPTRNKWCAVTNPQLLDDMCAQITGEM